MAKVILVRGFHPNERSAKFLTPKIAATLRKFGHEVIELNIPLEQTISQRLREVTPESPYIDYMNEYNKPVFEVLNQHPDAIVIDIHNGPYIPKETRRPWWKIGGAKVGKLYKAEPARSSRRPGITNYYVEGGKAPSYIDHVRDRGWAMLKYPAHYTIEIPAVREISPEKEMKKEALLSAVDEKLKSDLAAIQDIESDESRELIYRAIGTKNCIERYWHPFSLKASARAGLLSEDMANAIAKGIHKTIIPNHGKTRATL